MKRFKTRQFSINSQLLSRDFFDYFSLRALQRPTKEVILLILNALRLTFRSVTLDIVGKSVEPSADQVVRSRSSSKGRLLEISVGALS